MSRYGKYFGSYDYKNYLSELSRKDRKKAEFFTEILEDNKIKKSEAEELLKKGYTERDLQRFDSKFFKTAQDYYKSFHSRDKGYSSATLDYSPFTISRGAGNLFSSGLTPQQQPQQQSREETTPQPTGTATSMPQSYWMNQIDKLMGTITSQQQEAQAQAAAQQATFDQRLADLTAGFDTQTAQLTAGFQSQMEAANAARQQEIEGIMAANREQMGMLQTQQQERIQAMEASQAKLLAEQEARVQQMQIAQQTQAANAARAGQTGQFRVGADRAVGGISQFKRRLQIKPVASGALSLAGSPTRSSNKMLNV